MVVTTAQASCRLGMTDSSGCKKEEVAALRALAEAYALHGVQPSRGPVDETHRVRQDTVTCPVSSAYPGHAAVAPAIDLRWFDKDWRKHD